MLQPLQRVISAGVDVKLTIAGDGPERRRLEALASELGVAGNVKFLGELSHNDTLALMHECGIFLATSDRNEGWGATVNEAMSMGCCVIASKDMGSVPYLIENGVNGFAFADSDADGIVFNILDVLNDGKLARCLGAAAMDTANNLWCAREAACRFERLSRAVVAKGFDAAFKEEVFTHGPLSSSI